MTNKQKCDIIYIVCWYFYQHKYKDERREINIPMRNNLSLDNGGYKVEIVISDNLDFVINSKCNIKILVTEKDYILDRIANQEIYLAKNNAEAMELMNYLYEVSVRGV